MALPKWAERAGRRFAEAAVEISNADICSCLCDELKDQFPGQYAYVEAVFGDDESGDVVYCCAGDMKRCSYSISHDGDNISVSIDTASAYDVYRITTYVPDADSGVSESQREERVERFPDSAAWKSRPLSERFISKAERDSADASDFAGSGQSFPILRKSDVMAAVRSIGRGVAGGQKASTLKANIKKIAKRKGFGDELPQAWQAKEDAPDGNSTEGLRDIDIVGDLVPLREGAVGMDGTVNLKLIGPGWGSSGYYSPDVLRRDGPKIFTAGTKNFWDHPTAAEEAARPEGSLRNLASKLTETAHWDDAGPAGPGLYAKANVYEDYRASVDSLAKDIGMSIRASGRAREGKAEGKSGPIIEQLTKAASVDYVTTPGAGGKILQLFEAARGRQSNTEGENEMDEAAVKKLIEAANAPLAAENKALKEKLAEMEKPKLGKGKLIKGLLESIRLPKASKKRVIERVRANFPLTEAGEPNGVKLKELVEAEAKREAQYLTKLGVGSVQGLGASAEPAELKEADVEKEALEVFGRLTGDKKVAEIAARGRRAVA
jgi:hypothetical protein